MLKFATFPLGNVVRQCPLAIFRAALAIYRQQFLAMWKVQYALILFTHTHTHTHTHAHTAWNMLTKCSKWYAAKIIAHCAKWDTCHSHAYHTYPPLPPPLSLTLCNLSNPFSHMHRAFSTLNSMLKLIRNSVGQTQMNWILPLAFAVLSVFWVLWICRTFHIDLH